MVSHNLRQLQLAQLEILIEVDKVCHANDIKYFLLFGTLLGAIRHKGFIPWDDDIDIGMKRNDYDKFLEIANEKLNENYFCQSMFSDSHYYLPFAKIRKKDTICIEKSSQHLKSHKGIFIDLFPIDNVPESRIYKLIHNIEFMMCFKTLQAKFRIYEPKKYRVLKMIVYFILSLLPVNRNTVLKLTDKVMKKNVVKTPYVTSMCNEYGYNKCIVPSTIFDTLMEIEFEGRFFKAPLESHAYLSAIYGDYMTLPPVENQKSSHEIIEFSL